MAHQRRQVQRLDVSNDEIASIGSWMACLGEAEDGWINLIPKLGDDDQPTSLRFLTLFGGGSSGITMCTWIPGHQERKGRRQASLGLTHLLGHRAVPQLKSLAIVLPDGWFVEQDHPRRGLVIRLPDGAPHDEVLEWAVRATAALSPPRPLSGWRADVHLATSR